LSNESQQYDSGFATSYQSWIGKYAGKSFNYFARHRQGRAIDYCFNSLGYRGAEHYLNPDISVFGSSFSFGVGIEFDQCWHQHLGNYRVNCYAPAGFLATNNDIIEHYHQTTINSGIVILQLREFQYNTSNIEIPQNVLSFVVDQTIHPTLVNLPWESFVDRAEDNTHPGPQTHQIWAQTIKKTYNL
jgi:hypothetical protein